MHYTGEVYRPPMEAYTPLLEVTVGCSYNKCAFCTMYRNSPFKMSPEENIISDLKELSEYKDRIDRIYILNGNPFVLATNKLLRIAELIHKYLPNVKTITCYSSVRDLKNKSQDDLEKLHAAGYNDLYIGVETAYAPALKMINKGYTVEEEFEQLHKLKAAGMDYTGVFMLGIAGKGNSEKNVEATAKLFNETHPKLVVVMTTSVAPGSELEKIRDAGEYVQLTEGEIIEEEIMMLKALDVREDGSFWGAHVFDTVPIAGKLTQKDKMIKALEDALANMTEAERNSTLERGHI